MALEEDVGRFAMLAGATFLGALLAAIVVRGVEAVIPAAPRPAAAVQFI